jgi:hypothetical protein
MACVLFVPLDVEAAEAPADATSAAVVGSHEEATPDLFLYAVEGGALEVVVDCSACLLDVEVVRWQGANGQREEEVDTATDIVNDVIDAARIELPQGLAGQALALEMHATLLSEDGTTASEVQRVMFVAMTEDETGLSTAPISWSDYLVANSLARVEQSAAGTRVLNLSGGAP